ncbi:MAG: SpoIIE family protein phosphatase [Anaerolinea sp.]|nr:SpoIIE family protein phosphatase [Anaerolinea sp.]
MDESISTILQNTFNNRLDQATLDTLRPVAQRHTYPAQTTLVRQGEYGDTFFVIVAGSVAAIQMLENGEERLLGVLRAGEYFGEMGLIDDTPRMATCVALEETTVFEITEEVFDRLIEENPVVAHSITRQIVKHARARDHLSIVELQQKNRALQQAYADLQAAQARLVEKERLEHELELAAAVQRNLLPGDLPQFPDYHFAAYLHPARQVGGDFYDVVVLDDEHVALLIADVADKGFHAALFMAVTRTLFLQEGKHSLSPVQVAQAVHQGMMDVARADESFVTAFYGVLHRPSGILRYVRAGQERPLLIRPQQAIIPLPGDGRFLGMMPNLRLQEYTLQLQPGDRLVLFSDGVPDAVNASGQHYGGGRLLALLQQHDRDSATNLVAHILDDVNLWRGQTAAFDDLTLLVMEVGGRSSEPTPDAPLSTPQRSYYGAIPNSP